MAQVDGSVPQNSQAIDPGCSNLPDGQREGSSNDTKVSTLLIGFVTVGWLMLQMISYMLGYLLIFIIAPLLWAFKGRESEGSKSKEGIPNYLALMATIVIVTALLFSGQSSQQNYSSATDNVHKHDNLADTHLSASQSVTDEINSYPIENAVTTTANLPKLEDSADPSIADENEQSPDSLQDVVTPHPTIETATTQPEFEDSTDVSVADEMNSPLAQKKELDASTNTLSIASHQRQPQGFHCNVDSCDPVKDVARYILEFVVKSLPGQSDYFWRVLRSGLRGINSPTANPVCIIVSPESSQDYADVLDCLSRHVECALTGKSTRSSSFNITGSESRMELESWLEDWFGEKGHRLAVLHNIESMSVQTASLFYKYCDDNPSPQFPGTVLLNIIPHTKQDTIGHQWLEQALKSRWSDNEDVIRPILVRIGNIITSINTL